MAARKEKKTKKAADFSKRKEILKNSESYKSLFYGIMTVVILFILGIGAVKLFLNQPRKEIDSQAVSISRIDEALREAKESGKTYTVQENESLWDISVKKYDDGNKWVEIAKVNKIANPDTIFKGDKLIIPAITGTLVQKPEESVEEITPVSVIPEQIPENTSLPQKITGKTYTIKAGDDLWNIAVRAYGDGYRWTDIATANNLTDPGLIFSDNVLKIPRQ